jgi:hypothetical protein
MSILAWYGVGALVGMLGFAGYAARKPVEQGKQVEAMLSAAVFGALMGAIFIGTTLEILIRFVF